MRKKRVKEKEREKFRKFFEKQKEWNGLLKEYGSDILTSDNFLKTKEYIQHGNMTVNSHCINVAIYSLAISRKLNISCNQRDLVRGALLHDYFLYYMLRCGFEPEKIYRIARTSFAGQYDDEIILKWMKVFYKRFFSQQFKRSCLPDGPKVGSVAVSPRGDLRMPSDACVRVWMEQLEREIS